MNDLSSVFTQLRSIMAPFAEHLDVKHDTDAVLYLDTRHILKNGKPLFFGAVQLKKAYVSYHLMPVYVSPDLLDPVSTELKARMQGKSCFNFKRLEPSVVAELKELTRAGYESYRSQGYI